MSFPRRILLLLALLTLGMPAASARQDAGPFESRLRRGRTAMEKGDKPAALTHLSAALALRPDSLETLQLLFENAEGQADDRLLWGHDLWLAACDERGAFDGASALEAQLQRVVPGAAALAKARAEAVAELAKLCAQERKSGSKDSAATLVAAWCAELGRDLTRPMPKLSEARARDWRLEFEANKKQIDQVLKTLKRVHSRAASNGEHSVAVRAARIGRGLAAQGGFDDLQGPEPAGISALKRWAEEALAKSRDKLAGKLGEPLTIDELQEMDDEQAREFSRRHSDQSYPAVALSPRSAYRIETCCGYETLLGVAQTVEDHHDRLAKWYGEDPFEKRQGLVRVLPEAAGLEAEGSPYWWAGGFQGGDTTTLRFSCSTIEGFGHGLTHELTHRFDGALFPGMPGWLAEGRAVWTGGSYSASYDEDFVDDHIQFGTVESAWMKGYGGEKKLRELITGEIEDYRDNYVAGYALYVYLKLWQDGAGKPVYADRVLDYMRGLRDNGSKQESWFVKHFADGGGGRPADFKSFAQAFEEFLAGFYWDDRAEWTSRYTPEVPAAGGSWVYDAPTWTWSRSRAEPYWGQDHAWRAGELFLDLDQEANASQAFLWAWSVDERSPRRMSKLAQVLASVGKEEAAWVLENEALRERWGSAGSPVSAAACPLRLPKTRALLAAMKVQVKALQDAKRSRAASAFAADHDRLAAWLAEPPLGVASVEANEKALHPWNPAARAMSLEGYEESGLTGYEERREEGCWFSEPDGDLHVGRFKPREATGLLDRKAHNRHAFVLTENEQAAGRYELRCRVQFTTSFASGALVLGYTRRDRNIRMQFSAGDFFYSIGKKEQSEEIEKVAWNVSGLRDRDGPLSGSLKSGMASFDSPRTNFALRVVVDGAAAHFWIEEEYLGAYHDALGTPIAGRLGFATRMGAIRVIEPTLQRLDRDRQAGVPLVLDEEMPIVAGLDLVRPTEVSFRHLLNRPVAGMTPDVTGTLLVWVPMNDPQAESSQEAEEDCVAKALKLADRLRSMQWRSGADQPLLLALPDKLSAAAREQLSTELPEVLEGATWSTLYYEWVPEPAEQDLLGQHRSWLGFIDSAGILRYCDRFFVMDRSFPDELLHWVTVFRDDDGSE